MDQPVEDRVRQGWGIDESVPILHRQLPQYDGRCRADPVIEQLQQVRAPAVIQRREAEVIENGKLHLGERKFKKRFGFVWPPAQRVALIRLKHERGLTDPEIRQLRWSGVLRRTPTGVTLASAVWAALWGGVILGYLALLTLAVLIATVPSIVGGAPITARYVGVLGLMGVFGYLIWWLHIEPWRIERRTRPTNH